MKNRTPIDWRKAVASLLSLQLALGPVATPSYAALTKLADEPIAFTPSAEPSVVLTVDDWTSMLSDFLPDYIIGSVPGALPAVGGFCRDSSGLMSVPCGFGGSATSPQYIFTTGSVPYPTYATGNPPNSFTYTTSSIPDRQRAWPAPVHNNALNRIWPLSPCLCSSAGSSRATARPSSRPPRACAAAARSRPRGPPSSPR